MAKASTISGKKVVVANATRSGPCHFWDFESKVFASAERAQKWIAGQIDNLVAEYSLDRDKAVEN